MLHFAHAWLGLMIDVSIKSLLIAVAAGLALRLLRIRDTNLRHRVWTAVMMGMLALPALVHLTPAIPLPNWLTIGISPTAVDPRPSESQSDSPPIMASPRIAAEGDRDLPSAYRVDAESDPMLSPRSPAPVGPESSTRSDPPPHIPVANPAVTAPQRTGEIAKQWPMVLAGLYAALAAFFAVRLLVGLTLSYRLVRRAREITLPTVGNSLCGVPTAAESTESSSTAGTPQRAFPTRRSRFLESDLITVPATVGYLHPVVLLPIAWRTWSETKLRAVLAHELAHVRRADWLVITLAELNRALYWFHPLAWFLRRRLSELAEQNCDDAVLEADGDRTQYARYLLEVAASLTTAGSRYRPPLSGVAMARKPNVETRIDAILDANRPLARRLSALGAIALLVSGVTAVLLAAALRTAADEAPKKPAAGLEMKGPAKGSSLSPLTGEGRGAVRLSSGGDGVAEKKIGAPPTASADKQYHVHGQVLDPDGKPVAGATVYAAWGMEGLGESVGRLEDLVVSQTKADREGNYELIVSADHPDPKRLTNGWHVTAFAAGFGPAWQRDVQVVPDSRASRPTTLVLTNDQPVHGRFVDLEGNPLAGIRVRVYGLKRPENERAIPKWIEDAKKKSPPANPADYSSPGMDRKNSPYPGPFPAQWNDGCLAHGSLALPAEEATDRDGRVDLRGLGVDRLAILEIEGPSIATSLVQVVVRRMEPLSAQPTESIGLIGGTYYGDDFQCVAGPTQPIVGTVTDAETHQPLAGLVVHLRQFAGNLMSQDDFLVTRTDDHGQFKLTGAPQGGGHWIEVAPTPEQPYFPTTKQLERASGFGPITCDFALRRGRWIVGQVIDQATKAPPIAKWGTIIEYLPLRDNEHAKDYPNYDPNITGSIPRGRYHAAADGSFRVLAIPGGGVLAAIAREDNLISGQDIYAPLSADQIPKHLVQANGYLKTYHPFIATEYHALKEVNIPESPDETSCDLQVSRGLSRRIRVVDRQGHPVTGVRILGRRNSTLLEKPANDSTVEIVGLRPNDNRIVVFIQAERKLGKTVTIGSGEEMTVELEPCAIARGRVVSEDGKPVSKLTMKTSISSTDNRGRLLLEATTGDDGRFEALLAPGLKCRIYHFDLKPVKFGVSAEFDPKPDAVYELGDLTNGTKLKTEQTDKMIVKPSAPTAQESRSTGVDTITAKRSTIHGRIVGVDGKPAVGADVAVIAFRKVFARDGGLEQTLVAETKSDGDGQYQIELANPSKTHRNAHVIARAATSALAQRPLDLSAAEFNASFQLEPEETISGRLVDIEGQPAAGVRLQVNGVMRQADNDHWSTDDVGVNIRAGHLPAAWPQAIVSDDKGRFLIHGIPKSHGVEMYVCGDDRFAPQNMYLSRGISEQPAQSGAAFHWPVKNVKSGEEALFVLAPAQLFTGVVRYEDTGEPAPHAFLAVGSSQSEFGSPWISTYGSADEHGRYQINPWPGVTFNVEAFPAEHAPYLARQMRSIKWEGGARSKKLDVKLSRGVLVNGKVVEQGTNYPIAGAYVQYYPGAANRTDQIVFGWHDMHQTDDRGQFEIAVPSRAGSILASAPTNDYVLRELSRAELLGRGVMGNERQYAHGIERIDPPANSAPLTLEFHLQRGATIRGELVDQQGAPVEGAAMISRLNVSPSSLTNNTFPAQAMGGRFEISSLAPGQECAVYFLNAERRLGASLTVKAGMTPQRVVLEPCGAAKMRFVDEGGHPVANYRPRIGLIVTPGGPEFDYRGPDTGTPAADFLFIGNVDRVNHPVPEKADGQGRLTLSALIPGATYHIVTNLNEGPRVQIKELKPVASETVDLGDITVAIVKETVSRSTPAESSPTRKQGNGSADSRVKIHGRVVGADGKPAAGVDVAVIARRTEMGRGGDLGPTGAVLGEVKSDADGAYRIELAGVSSKTHRDASIIARGNGTALAWRKLNLDAGDVEASFDLRPEEAIAGRLVDIEGQPAAGVHVDVGGVMAQISPGQPFPNDGIGLFGSFNGQPLPAPWPKQIITDNEGRFIVHGVPKNQGVYLDVEGSDRFAPQDISLNTGMTEQRGERDATYRPLVKNVKPGEEAVLPLAPAQLFTGTVRYGDTGEPAAFARLTVWASQQEFGSMYSLAGKADETGRYKISPHPGIRFGVTAYPPDGAPYLASKKDFIPWEASARSKVVDMRLPRGVLIHGKVLEEGADTPIAGASVQYHAESASNPNRNDDIVAGWNDIHLTDKEGRFSIVVLPGPGRLLVHAPNETYVLKEISGQELYKGKPGGERNYAHAIERIDPAAKTTPPEIVIRLQRGATVRGEIVDHEGKPVEEVEMFSRLHISPLHLNWNAYSVAAKGGRFEVSGLAPDQEYPVCFLNSERRLGATLIVKAGMPTPRVVLEPCGGVTMRFVDDQGKPVAKMEPTIELVVTPGKLRYSTDKMDADKLAADADFIANVDRANHSLPEKSSDDGRLTVSALIPGATYQVITYRKQKFVLSKEFQAIANETIDLGDIAVERKE